MGYPVPGTVQYHLPGRVQYSTVPGGTVYTVLYILILYYCTATATYTTQYRVQYSTVIWIVVSYSYVL